MLPGREANINPFNGLLERIRQLIPPDQPVYLVGGAVRDLLLSRTTHDMDFVLSGDVLGFGRRVAKALGGVFYPLDEERETARVILIEKDGSRYELDFAAMRGQDLDSDLRARDFTLNAMAISISDPEQLIDPLGGAADLHTRVLRACSEMAFRSDPVRVLRGVRLATAFGLKISPDTRKWLREAVPMLEQVSIERKRDELFRILDGLHPSSALRALDQLGVFPYLLPELQELKGVPQSSPHVADVWEHTLSVVSKLDSILEVLAPTYDEESAANLILGLVALKLGRYRGQIRDHMETNLILNRSIRGLLFLAVLYHDIAKPQTSRIDPDGRIRFFEHETTGGEIIYERATALHLSNVESLRLKTVIRNHMRPLLLAQSEQAPSHRAIYRFFRDTGAAGVDICLLSLADTLGTYEHTLPQEVWVRHLDLVRTLLAAWWENKERRVNPAPVVNGDDLMDALGLKPGPLVGELLELIREAQVSGEVQDRHQALELARHRFKQLDGESHLR